MTSSGGLELSRPAARSKIGMITLMSSGPTRAKPHQPPEAMKASAKTMPRPGTIIPSSHRYRFLSFHTSVVPSGTVLPISSAFIYNTVVNVNAA